jgi:hypothetical protein
MSKTIWRVAFLSLILAAVVRAQDRHGTIAVVRYRDTRVTIAADSRTNLGWDAAHVVKDDECKLTNLGEYAVFVASGFTGYDNNGPRDRLASWRATSEARRVFSELLARDPVWLDSRLDELAMAWGKAVQSKTIELAQYNPSAVRRSAVNGLLTTAFVASGRRSIISAAVVQLGIDARGSIELLPIRRITPEVCPPCALGRGEIVTEFLEVKSERARAESQRFARETKGLPETELDKRLVTRLVDLTIRLLPDQAEVGGPIDVLQLDAGKGIRWNARKPTCPE